MEGEWAVREGEWPVRESAGTGQPRQETEMFHGGSQALLHIIMTILITTSFSGPLEE